MKLGELNLGLCDIDVKLRVCGNNPCCYVTTDEGDGVSFRVNKRDITKEVIKAWKNQLVYISNELDKLI
jgi:hypothetical protein